MKRTWPCSPSSASLLPWVKPQLVPSFRAPKSGPGDIRQVATMNSDALSVIRVDGGISISYGGMEFVASLGVGLPINGAWLWSFDGSLKLVEESRGSRRDRLGTYDYFALLYSAPLLFGEDVPLLRQEVRTYGGSRVLIETTALEDVRGTYLSDSFFETTWNSPVLLFPEDLNFLAYTWGLIGLESSRDGGHFPEAVTGSGVSNIPARLKAAGYSPREDLSTIADKPFCPLVLYDGEGRTMVASPFNHFLISPMRVVQTPAGPGVARGLHGSVNVIPKGTTTSTALVFGQGVEETMSKWGDWLLEVGGKSRDLALDGPLLGGIGFWNCFGGYYTELFRSMDEGVLRELAQHFQRAGIPISYFGLDLWYNFDQVGFAKSYSPDATKYPRGLGALHRETGLPYLLHMSAFESPNDYIGRHEFALDRASAYPTQRTLYDELAKDFQESGAIGIWPDFLRTQLQNCSSLKNRIGEADRLFDDLCQAYGDRELGVMMCMPTIGHYLASTRHDNVVAVRTHTDYLNHQKSQVEALTASGQVRNLMSLQQSIRHNVLLSLLAHVLGLRPSYDVFLTNTQHPEGFADPNASTEALLRAMSAGVVAVGDQVGYLDRDIVGRLCFPDGRTSRPDHPAVPVISTLQSEVLGFYTTTILGSSRWVYLALFNVGERRASYALDVRELCGDRDVLVYDYFGAEVLETYVLEGELEPAQGRYFVLVPKTGEIAFLGFPGKYITVSNGQVTSVDVTDGRLSVALRLPSGPPALAAGVDPPGQMYTVAVYPSTGVGVEVEEGEVVSIHPMGDLLQVDFVVKTERPSLYFRMEKSPRT